MEMYHWYCDKCGGQTGVVIAEDDAEALYYVRAQLEVENDPDTIVALDWVGRTEKGCYILSSRSGEGL